jgi:cytochrome c biogenesis protein CcmG, thiol:disulfide interchange protein DsbE
VVFALSCEGLQGATAPCKTYRFAVKRVIPVVVIVLVLGALFTFGLFRTDKNRDIPSARLNQPAREFDLPVFERYQGEYGPTFKLADYIGQKPIVINFWASWCGPCRDEMPMLQEVSKRYKDKILFVGIQESDTKDAGNDFLNQFNVLYPNLMDNLGGKSQVGIDYALFGLPETFFVRMDGTLLYKQPGPLTANVLEEKIGELLQ